MSVTSNTSANNSSSSSSNTIPSLLLGDINLLVLTDVHSWIGGHERHEPSLNADYGHVLSFYLHLKDIIRRRHERRDFFMVMNGDFLDGTGLSTVPPKQLTPLLANMPFSIINVGNHELYHSETVEWISKEFIPRWRGHYLSSNTLLKATGGPLGNRFTYLQGDHSTLLAFGFLYNFEGNCNTTIVERVQDVVTQEWFVDVLQRQEAYDAILVMAHMHVTDPLVEVIRVAIRELTPNNPTMPIQFITGHTHIRSFVQLEDHAASFEAGRFLDTIGFCSFPRSSTKGNQQQDDDDDWLAEIRSDDDSPTASKEQQPSRFEHVFLEPNQKELASLLASFQNDDPADNNDSNSNLDSSAGRLLSTRIHETQQQLGLNNIVGCAPSTYELLLDLPQKQSLWGLYMFDIVPTMLFSNWKDTTDKAGAVESKPIFVQGTGAFRYNLFQGLVVLDDVIAVCPFNDTIFQITQDLTGQQLLQVLNTTNTNYPNQVPNSNNEYSALPYFAISTNDPIEAEKTYDLLTSHFHVPDMVQRVELVLGYPIPDPNPVQSKNHHHAPGEFWTTTNLWQSYIEQEWPCDDTHTTYGASSPVAASRLVPAPATTTTTTTTRTGTTTATTVVIQDEKPLTVLFFIALSVCCLYIYQKRKEHLQRSGYVPIGDPTTSFLQNAARSFNGSNFNTKSDNNY